MDKTKETEEIEEIEGGFFGIFLSEIRTEGSEFTPLKSELWVDYALKYLGKYYQNSEQREIGSEIDDEAEDLLVYCYWAQAKRELRRGIPIDLAPLIVEGFIQEATGVKKLTKNIGELDDIWKDEGIWAEGYGSIFD